jgi:hypothetical protein
MPTKVNSPSKPDIRLILIAEKLEWGVSRNIHDKKEGRKHLALLLQEYGYA